MRKINFGRFLRFGWSCFFRGMVLPILVMLGPRLFLYIFIFWIEIFFTRDSIDRRCLKILESYSSSFINCFFLLISLFLLFLWFPYLPLFSLPVVSVLLLFWVLILLLLLFLILFLNVLCVVTKFFDFWCCFVLYWLVVLCIFVLFRTNN